MNLQKIQVYILLIQWFSSFQAVIIPFLQKDLTEQIVVNESIMLLQ